MMTFLEAVAREEGWLDPKSRPRRNHNPGDIEAGRFATAHGAIGSDGRFAIFASDEDGFAAMRALFQAPLYRGLTVVAAIEKWAPSNENNTGIYVARVCGWSGCHRLDVIDGLLLGANASPCAKANSGLAGAGACPS